MERRDPAGPRSRRASPGRTAPPDLLPAALAYALAAVARVDPGDHGRPSPCAGWTVDDVLRHQLESFDCLTAALNFGRVDLGEGSPEPRRGDLPALLAASARGLDRAARRRSPATPIAVGELPLARPTVILVAVVEAAVHGWDVSAGAGRPLPIPDPLAIELLERLPEVTGAGIGAFAPPLVHRDGDTPGGRLLASLGRDRSFAPHGARAGDGT